MYSHLHVHSTFSFLEGIGTLEKLVKQAKELGYTSLALTDYQGMYGALNFYLACKYADMKAIIGVELSITHDIATLKHSHKSKRNPTITLIAEDYEGYENLLKLTSLAHTLGQDIPCVDFGMIAKYHQGIIGFMGGQFSLVGDMILQGINQDKILDIVRLMQDTFGPENRFLEVIAQDYKLEPSLKQINDNIIELAQKSNSPLIVNSNVHYIKAESKLAYEAALAIKDNNRLSDPMRRIVKGDYHLMSADEVTAVLQKN